MRIIKLEDLNVYKIAFDLSNELWDIVIRWGWFEKDTVGKQLVRAADSISANIAEGYGRNGRADKCKFYTYARASVLELEDWINKARQRNLLTENSYCHIIEKTSTLPRMINYQIKYTRETLKE